MLPATAPTTRRHEIDHLAIKLIVGVIALSLPALVSSITRLTGGEALGSVSEAYHRGGLARDVLVGLLFAVAAFLFAYNGYAKQEAVASRIASLAAAGVALLPCKCGSHDEVITGAHAAAATILFGVLVYFCWRFAKRAKLARIPQAQARAVVFQLCGAVMTVALVTLVFDRFTSDSLSGRVPTLVYWGETAALTAFGVAWLTASRVLPLLTRSDERYRPFSAVEPVDLAARP